MDLNMLKRPFSRVTAIFCHWSSALVAFSLMVYWCMLSIKTWWAHILIFIFKFLWIQFFNALCKASSVEVSLLYGHIVVKIVSNGEHLVLKSLQTYTSGANQLFSLSLSNSSLVLRTSLEETRMRLEFTKTEALLNHTNVFLCGVPDDLVNKTGGISNFTGCAVLSSRVLLDPLPLNCVSSVQQRACSYCLNEVWRCKK